MFPKLRTYSGHQKYKKGKDCTYYGESGPILVRRLVAEESGKSDVLDITLSCGLCGIVVASGDMSSSCAVISTPLNVCDDGIPRLNNGAGDGVRRLSATASEGNEREDRVDASERMPPIPGRYTVLEPTT